MTLALDSKQKSYPKLNIPDSFLLRYVYLLKLMCVQVFVNQYSVHNFQVELHFVFSL